MAQGQQNGKLGKLATAPRTVGKFAHVDFTISMMN